MRYDMAYFPFMMDMNNRKCVIAGGGKVAAGKAETMLMFGACVTVVSPVFSLYFYDKFEESDRIILKALPGRTMMKSFLR